MRSMFSVLTENNNHLVPVIFKSLSFLKLAVHFFEMYLSLVAYIQVTPLGRKELMSPNCCNTNSSRLAEMPTKQHYCKKKTPLIDLLVKATL